MKTWLHCSVVMAVLALTATAQVTPPANMGGPARDTKLVDLGTNAFDRTNLSELGTKTLTAKEFKWRHGQTTHFVLHFENAIFAQKVARMSEFFHDYIAADLGLEKDLDPQRSHIFIFNTKKDWDFFLANYARNGMEWSASFVRGPEMFLQQTGGGADAADTLGHEMTHLVVNRFFEGNPPLSINEGIAEWYGEFAYSAFKGVKKSKKQEFRRLDRAIPLNELLEAKAYPANREAIENFYLTSKYFIGFLMIRQPAKNFGPFFADATRGMDIVAALQKHYGFTDFSALEKDFARFTK